MRPIYFSSFLLGQLGSTPPNFDQVEAVLSEWIFKPSRGLERPASFSLQRTESVNLGRDHTLTSKFLDPQSADQQHSVMAIRLEHPGDDNTRWRTDVIVSHSNQSGSMRASTRVSNASVGSALTPLFFTTSTPVVVPALIAKFGAHEVFNLFSTPINLRPTDRDDFAEMLEHTDRQLPILLITATNDTDEYLIEFNRLAAKLAGLCYVCVVRDRRFTLDLADIINNRLVAYDGAVRVYWPGFSRLDSPYRHPLWLRTSLEDARRPGDRSVAATRDIWRMIANASAARNITDHVSTWEQVDSLVVEARLVAAKKAGDQTEWIEALEDENRQISERCRGYEQERIQLYQAVEKEKRDKEYWRTQFESIRALSSEPQAPEDEELIDYSSVPELIELARDTFVDSLRIPDSAIRDEILAFEKGEMLWKGLSWLAHAYRDSKIGAVPCPDLAKSCLEASGLNFSPHQSDVTMGMYPQDYQITVNGQKFELKEHLRRGSGTDPRHNCRIAFAFDSRDKKVIVGFLGQHQQNRNSN